MHCNQAQKFAAKCFSKNFDTKIPRVNKSLGRTKVAIPYMFSKFLYPCFALGYASENIMLNQHYLIVFLQAVDYAAGSFFGDESPKIVASNLTMVAFSHP